MWNWGALYATGGTGQIDRSRHAGDFENPETRTQNPEPRTQKGIDLFLGSGFLELKANRLEFLRCARSVHLEIKALSFFLLNLVCTHIVEDCGKEFLFPAFQTPCAFEMVDLDSCSLQFGRYIAAVNGLRKLERSDGSCKQSVRMPLCGC